MLNEKDVPGYGISQRQIDYAFQENFFNIVEHPGCEILGIPTRSRQDFWREDVLPTSILLRRIYVGNYQSEEGGVLEWIWQWLKDDDNSTLIKEGSLGDSEVIDRLPHVVILNYSTTFFFTMEDDFKNSGMRQKVWVGFPPNLSDWENDVRGITIGDYEKLWTRPFELGKMKHTESRDNSEAVSEKLKDFDCSLIQRCERNGAVTWVLLMRYHLELVRREKKALEILRSI